MCVCRHITFALYCKAYFPTVVIQIASHRSLGQDMLDKSCLHARTHMHAHVHAQARALTHTHAHTQEPPFVSQAMWASGFSLTTVNSSLSKANGDGHAGMRLFTGSIGLARKFQGRRVKCYL